MQRVKRHEKHVTTIEKSTRIFAQKNKNPVGLGRKYQNIDTQKVIAIIGILTRICKIWEDSHKTLTVTGFSIFKHLYLPIFTYKYLYLPIPNDTKYTLKMSIDKQNIGAYALAHGRIFSKENRRHTKPLPLWDYIICNTLSIDCQYYATTKASKYVAAFGYENTTKTQTLLLFSEIKI